ncbi:RNA ligase-domain-containing protein [Sporodiniella umbellata]|nr:RNA ligase-domain-containing protein [Sporodiniella umbellata]
MNTIDIPAIGLEEDQTQAVIEKLYEIKAVSKDVRSREFQLEQATIWNSWIVRESLYKKKPERLPSLARGLFTKNTNGKQSIVARGYDKFFNVLETGATQWPALESDTLGPYEITAKENGCIIFIAALSEDKLVVTSKHSIPENKTDPQAHAGVGYNWLIDHLASVEKEERDLACWLSEKNVTLVAELCDDDFQQHILPYTGKLRGLYLHGINYNTATLKTLPSATVQQVANALGMHRTEYKTYQTIQEVKKFGQTMQLTGCYDGREIEGVVVRCKKAGNDFMFKIKNEQYLQYREYREMTKAVLQVTKDGNLSLNLEKKIKTKYPKTEFYLDWLNAMIEKHPEWFVDYKSEKGIIFTREQFEKYWKETGPTLSIQQ